MKDLEKEVMEIKELVQKNKILMYPPLKKSEVIEFCHKYDVDLPEEYVLFLTEIGDGWKETINEVCDTSNMNRLSESFRVGENLRKEFPFTESWVWEDGGGDNWSQMEGESDEKYKERLKSLREEALNGQIELIDVGGGGGWCLIISGKSKGEVWFVCGEGVGSCVERLSFFEWLRKWLNGIYELEDYL